MPRLVCFIFVLCLAVAAGCGSLSRYGPTSQPFVPPPVVSIPAEVSAPAVVVAPGSVPNGLLPAVPSSAVIVPVTNRDAAWDQIVDVVDDYFQIQAEDRVKVVGDMLTPGRIDTFPVTGATIFEPWRRDSANAYERWESTLQSIQRRAFVRVDPTPGENTYVVDVTVLKELEDVPRPTMATAGAATFRFDTSMQRDTEFDPDPMRAPGDPARPVGPRSPTAGWIPLGRDTALEQEMLAKIRTRLGGYPAPPMPGVAPSSQFIGPGAVIVPPTGVPQQLPSP
jgi:hypothetical protein